MTSTDGARPDADGTHHAEGPDAGADPDADSDTDADTGAAPGADTDADDVPLGTQVAQAVRRRRTRRWAGARVPRGAGAAQAAALATEAEQLAAPPPRPGLWTRVVRRTLALWTWWQHSRAGRAYARFGAVGGGVLTGGIAYSALFSVFAALALGYTIFTAVLGDNDALRLDVLTTVDANLPGLIDTGDNRGLIDPDDLVLSAGLSVAGVGAIGVLLFSASLSMAALRTAVRAVFGHTAPQNLLVGKARELAGVAGVAVAILLSAVLTLAVTALADAILGALGWDAAARVVGRVIGVLVAFALDVGMFVLVVRVLADLHPPRRDLLRGALLAGVGMGVVRLLGTSVVAGAAGRNALLASFTVLVTLLVWINLLARIVLVAAAWTADPPLPDPDADGTVAPAP
jgi:membrane protein